MRSVNCPDQTLLREHLDGSLPVDDEGGVVSHLDGCEQCRRALENLATGGERWLAVARQIGEEPPVASPIWDEVSAGLGSGGHSTTELDKGPFLTLLGLAGEPDQLGRLDHYTLHEIIGHGSMGVVLRAFDEKLKRVVAVKVLSPVWAARGCTSAFARVGGGVRSSIGEFQILW